MILHGGLGVTGKINGEEEIKNESSNWSGYFKRGKSVQAFLNKGKPYRKSFKVSHTNEALDSLLHFLKEVENESGKEDYSESYVNMNQRI
jgi:hypothetical protein